MRFQCEIEPMTDEEWRQFKEAQTQKANDDIRRERESFFAQKLLDRVPPRVMSVLQKRNKPSKEYSETVLRMAKEGGLIIGPLGTGKTCCMFDILLSRSIYPNAVFSATELADKLRDMNQYRDLIRYLSGVEFLAIDDMGSEKIDSEHYKAALLHIFDFRYNNELPTLITANLKLFSKKVPSFSELYGERITERIAEMCPERNRLALTEKLRKL